MRLMNWVRRIGSYAKKALAAFKVEQFVPNDILAWALEYVKAVAKTQLDNAGKREWVVDRLHRRFPQISESVIRLAVELAVRIAKSKL